MSSRETNRQQHGFGEEAEDEAVQNILPMAIIRPILISMAIQGENQPDGQLADQPQVQHDLQPEAQREVQPVVQPADPPENQLAGQPMEQVHDLPVNPYMMPMNIKRDLYLSSDSSTISEPSTASTRDSYDSDDDSSENSTASIQANYNLRSRFARIRSDRDGRRAPTRSASVSTTSRGEGDERRQSGSGKRPSSQGSTPNRKRCKVQKLPW